MNCSLANVLELVLSEFRYHLIPDELKLKIQLIIKTGNPSSESILAISSSVLYIEKINELFTTFVYP